MSSTTSKAHRFYLYSYAIFPKEADCPVSENHTFRIRHWSVSGAVLDALVLTVALWQGYIDM